MAKKSTAEYRGGRIKSLVETVADIMRKNPTMSNEHLHTTLRYNLHGYGDRKKCYNCERSMRMTVHTAGLFEGLLLLRMAEYVQKQIQKGVSFTDANKVHVPSIESTDAVRHVITHASCLGLVAQPDTLKNTGFWVITSWGWKALRGEEVPRKTTWWNGQLIGRSEEMTTLSQMFQTHIDALQKQIEQKKAIKNDYRDIIRTYSPSDWIEYIIPEEF